MRARLIKPGFYKNDILAQLPPLTRILFSGLWGLADRAGRLEDRPLRIKAEVLPYDACDPDAMLNDLARLGFIMRYRGVIQVVNFLKHQTPHVREPDSSLPSPDEHETSMVQASDKHDAKHPPSPAVPTIPEADTETVPEAEGDTSAPARATPPRRTYPAAFLAWWARYPAGGRDDQAGTYAEWKRQKPPPEALAAGMDRWEASERWHNGYIVSSKKWLKERRWEAEPEPAGSRSPPNTYRPKGMPSEQFDQIFVDFEQKLGDYLNGQANVHEPDEAPVPRLLPRTSP